MAPEMREILRGMSIASDTQDEFVTADDYYLQPQRYIDTSTENNPLHRVCLICDNVVIKIILVLVLASFSAFFGYYLVSLTRNIIILLFI